MSTEPSDEKQFNLGAAQSAKTVGERLLTSIVSTIEAIVAERNSQNNDLQRIIDTLTSRPNGN